MTSPAWTFAVAAVLIAVVDWVAVVRLDLRTERFAKPAVIVALLGVAANLEPNVVGARPWVVAALVASLAGDVLLLPGGRFRAGLAAFFLAQVAYLGSFVQWPLEVVGALIGMIGAAVLYAVAGRRIAAGAAATDRATGLAVIAYLIAISAMAVAATATLAPALVAGAWLFVASDAVLGWRRFVADPTGAALASPLSRLAVMVPYHVGQTLLVLSLAI
ncbi:MAG: lysoplasmalogenase family protein [Chloroflexota bacterium]